MAELFTLTVGGDIEFWPRKRQQQPGFELLITLQSKTPGENGTAQVAATKWTHYCLTTLPISALKRGAETVELEPEQTFCLFLVLFLLTSYFVFQMILSLLYV